MTDKMAPDLVVADALRPLDAIGYAGSAARVAMRRLDGAAARDEVATVADEVPVALVYNGRPHVVVMCTPSDLEDLAIGFTLSERIVDSRDEIERVEMVRYASGIEVQLAIAEAAAARLAGRGRAMASRTGCGVCGAEAIGDVMRPAPRVDAPLAVAPAALWRAGGALDGRQPLNRLTSSVHAAAWCTADGAIGVAREDVGRHNALDKVLGRLARDGSDPRAGFALVTSRASYELVLKCAVAGIPLLAAVSRPTALAIRLAEDSGITLVALLRGASANVYTHAYRMTS